MNPTPDNPLLPGVAPAPASATVSVDDTLRLLASAPLPAGLNERVHAVVMEAASPGTRSARILTWPAAIDRPALWVGSSWMRAAAAAAIVLVVAGGGWGVYQRVERPTAKVIVIPVAQPAAGGGFSSAGAIRTPQTVKGPALLQPSAKASKTKARRKAAGAAGSVPSRVQGAIPETVSAPAAAVGK